MDINKVVPELKDRLKGIKDEEEQRVAIREAREALGEHVHAARAVLGELNQLLHRVEPPIDEEDRKVRKKRDDELRRKSHEAGGRVRGGVRFETGPSSAARREKVRGGKGK